MIGFSVGHQEMDEHVFSFFVICIYAWSYVERHAGSLFR